MLSRISQQVTAMTIANKIGVTRSTVSRVLNNKAKKYRISDKTAHKILEAAKELNYVPNEMARNLRLRHTNSLSLVCGNFEHNWMQAILNGAEKLLDGSGYIPFLARHQWSIERELKEFQSIAAHHDEGVVCQPIPHSANYNILLERNIPVVFISDTLDSMPLANYVIWESGAAAKIAVQHLVQIGRRRIGFIGLNHPTVSTRVRFEAFQEVIEQAGLELNNEWIARESLATDLIYEGKTIIASLTKRVMRAGRAAPDALFVLNDAIAYMVLENLYKMGIKVPDDVAVIGLGDLPVSEDFAVGLSTVREPLEELGYQSMETLIDLIKNPHKGPIQRVIKSTELKIRRTTVS